MIASTPLPPWQPPLLAPLRLRRSRPLIIPYRTPIGFVQAYRRGGGNNDAFGEAWNKVWRGANDGFEKFVFEARKTAERLDRRYSVSRRVSSAAQSVADRAREIDREFAIGLRWRNFTLDFSRNWPRVCTADWLVFVLVKWICIDRACLVNIDCGKWSFEIFWRIILS